jgi:Cd2+/Zn2+-exporting ATPase
LEKKTLRVKGLSCTDCAARIQAGVARIDGVHSSVVDVNTGQLVVFLEGHNLPLGEIERVVQQTGHELEADGPGDQAGGKTEGSALLGFARFIFSRPETTRTATAGLLVLVGLVVALTGRYAAGTVLRVGSTILFAAAIAVGGFSLARYAFQELWLSKRLGINALMVIAVSGAVAIGEWAEAAIVVVLFSLGEALESYATDRARRALDSLLDLTPPTAHRLLASGETEEVRVEQLAIGERVLVRAGDRVSVDGIVRAGLSAVDQSPITGESVPVEKSPGDSVFAGTINTSGVLEVEVTHLAADSTLSRMVRLVKQAQAQQAPVQRFIDRFARVYTPAVAVAALLVATIPPLLLGQPFWGIHGWLMRALQMLVIACPCALVISTPVSLVSAMTNAASRGVLIKGGRHLEVLSRVRVFAFDKTGTLTQGKPTVTDVVSVCDCGRCHDTCGLEYASALEIQSSHPIARAVVEAAEERQVAIQRAEQVCELGGRGIEGSVGGVQVMVGSHSHFDAHIPHREDVCTLANDLSDQGKTPILVCHDGEVCSLFGVADTPRHESAEVIDTLKSAGGVHTVMLTGDHPVVAQAIGQQVGVDEVRAGLLPEDKMSAIAALAAERGLVAMVGDGVNDAPALAQADVGIAMGGAGSAQAMETADVVLMGDDLAQLPFIVRLSKRTRNTITTNIVFALAIKAAVFGLAAAGLATLWMAIVADVGASLAVIVNGMRLRRAG